MQNKLTTRNSYFSLKTKTLCFAYRRGKRKARSQTAETISYWFSGLIYFGKEKAIIGNYACSVPGNSCAALSNV
ncbi:MAG: hypothetical protein DRQ43_07645 [Gammaproteobacteria bacterium]|nr:MAG: hypothetical protein DRQ43_07645 [Gammaproteobacteria bacterium]